MAKFYKILISVFVFTIFMYAESDTSTVVIGKLIFSDNELPIENIAILKIEIRDDSNYYKVSEVKNGNFSFEVSNDKSKFDLFYSGIGINERVFLEEVFIGDRDTIFLSYQLPKQYELGLLRKPKCTKCRDKKHVIALVYDPVTFMKIENGDTIKSQIFDNKYHIQTDVGSKFDPKWYCKKDSIFF